jgi:hypothetical protein
MFKNLLRVIGLLFLASLAYGGYQNYRGGYFSLPELPEGAFALSFENGLRAILVDVTDERETRTYLGAPHKKTPKWFEDAWSTCKPPSPDERVQLANVGDGARLDAVCTIEADGKVYPRGVVFSVPKL